MKAYSARPSTAGTFAKTATKRLPRAQQTRENLSKSFVSNADNGDFADDPFVQADSVEPKVPSYMGGARSNKYKKAASQHRKGAELDDPGSAHDRAKRLFGSVIEKPNPKPSTFSRVSNLFSKSKKEEDAKTMAKAARASKRAGGSRSFVAGHELASGSATKAAGRKDQGAFHARQKSMKKSMRDAGSVGGRSVHSSTSFARVPQGGSAPDKQPDPTPLSVKPGVIKPAVQSTNKEAAGPAKDASKNAQAKPAAKPKDIQHLIRTEPVKLGKSAQKP